MKPLYSFEGIVIEGKKRGRLMGFPTANLRLSKNIPEGIYASKVEIDEREYIAAVFIGTAKTFNEYELKLEAYMLDFDEDIYNKLITVKLYNKLRDNKKFPSMSALITQIKKDVENVRQYFSENRD
jgi:riboflavin kinase/FMN adenylyltransferase